MGALGKLLGVVFGRVLSFFGTYISTKLLILAAAAVSFVVLLGTLTVLFNTLLNSIAADVPPQFQFALSIIPTNLPSCISAIITGRVALWLFYVKYEIIKIKLQG